MYSISLNKKQISIFFSTLAVFLTFSVQLFAQSPQFCNYNTTGPGNSYPFKAENGMETQFLYLAGEFNQPSAAPNGVITAVSFRMPDGDTLKNSKYDDLTIKMGQSSITTLTTGTFYSGSLTTVYFKDTVTLNTTTGPWITFQLDTPFYYDNSQSLIIDVGQCDLISGVGFNACRSNPLTDIRRIISEGGCPFVAGVIADAVVLFTGLTFCTPPAAPINTTPVADLEVCEGSNTVLYATASGPLDWYNDSTGTTLLHTGANFTTPFLYSTDTFYVRTFDVCPGAMTAIEVSVLGLPDVSISDLDTIYCTYDQEIVMTGNPAGGMFEGQGVSGNVFTPSSAGAGTWAVEYDYTDVNGCSNTAILYVSVDNCESIGEYSGDMVSVFPNPASESICIEFPEENDGVLTITDATGKTIQTRQFSALKTVQLDLSSFAPGVYMLKIENDEGFVLKRVVVER